MSLVPSATETLIAWGLPPVACTPYCEQPSVEVTVGGTKNPHIAEIVALRPDVVVMCHEENRREDAEALVAQGVSVHICSPATVDEVGPALAALASVVGADPSPELRGAPVERIEPLDIRAFIPIWRRPWMTFTGDTYGSSLLDAIGVRNIAAHWNTSDDAAGRYPEVEIGQVRAASPDLILAPTEPYSFTAEHLEPLAEIAPVLEVDGQDLFWWGVRTPGAVQRLRDVIAAAVAAE